MNRPSSGIAALVFGLSLFVLQDVAMKHFSGHYSMLELVFLRGLAALVPMVAAVVVTTGWRGLRAARPRLAILRGGLGFVSFAGYYLALAALPVAEVVAIVFAAPVLVIALSAVLLNESVGWRYWLGVLVGFAGVVVVAGPSGGVTSLPALLALAAAVCYAASIVVVRYIGPADRPWTISPYSMLTFQLAYQREILVAAKWKNSVENYSERYHCPNRHPGLAQGSIDMDTYCITVHEGYHSLASRGVGDATAYARHRSCPRLFQRARGA